MLVNWLDHFSGYLRKILRPALSVVRLSQTVMYSCISRTADHKMFLPQAVESPPQSRISTHRGPREVRHAGTASSRRQFFFRIGTDKDAMAVDDDVDQSGSGWKISDYL